MPGSGVKADEKALAKALLVEGLTPRDCSGTVGINPKRLSYVLEKWADRGWYDYGVACDLGWLTEEGRMHFVVVGWS